MEQPLGDGDVAHEARGAELDVAVEAIGVAEQVLAERIVEVVGVDGGEHGLAERAVDEGDAAVDLEPAGEIARGGDQPGSVLEPDAADPAAERRGDAELAAARADVEDEARPLLVEPGRGLAGDRQRRPPVPRHRAQRRRQEAIERGVGRLASPQRLADLLRGRVRGGAGRATGTLEHLGRREQEPCRWRSSSTVRCGADRRGPGDRETTATCYVGAVLTRKRQPDVVFEPVMRSPVMKRVDQVIRAVAAKDVILTLIGESGSGKEVLARRAHELSSRREGPFVPINCAAIPEALFESELFGHERGAFTGASGRARGKVEAAERGTLFLDEIGEMPMAMQAKLLRFLENRRYMRLGGSTKIEADVRLMFATLRPLEQEVQAGRFRGDLFYRIQGITVIVPPLRERRADIGPLLAQFLSQLAARHGVQPPRLSRKAKELLLGYDWPGNVRELRNIVETLCLLRDGRQVRPSDLPASVRAQAAPAAARSVASRGSAASSLITLRIDDGLEAMVQQIVEAALEVDGGNKIEAATRLQISPRTVQRYVASGRVRVAAETRRGR
ncbi:MAG TPA: sigma-54 dependent transcriptional regulator [Kofleriaceae bacterium]|nr:sigma-54 dependent transcriptional regulator [Kofleriaceae bacterium]